MTDKITVDRELLQKIVESLDSRCGTNAPERTEIIPVLVELLDAPAVEPSCRTDQQIVDQTEELAKFLLFWKYAYEPENETLMREAIHPKAEDSWQAACRVQEMLTDTDPMNAVAEVDDEPAPVQEPAGEVVGAFGDYSTVYWLRQTSAVGGGDPDNSRSWPIAGDKVYLSVQQPRKAVKLTSEEISQMWIDESFDAASHESCYMRGVRRGEAAFIAKNGLES